MGKLRRRTPWKPRRLVALAAVLAGLVLVAVAVPPPSEVDTFTCELGGSCSTVYAHATLAAAALLAAPVALILVVVAAVRWWRAPRTRAREAHPDRRVRG